MFWIQLCFSSFLSSHADATVSGLYILMYIHVSNREQGVASRHRLSVTVDGVELFSTKRGFILTKNGRQTQRNLPVQLTSTKNPLMGMKIDALPVDKSLPTKVWKQYGRVRVLYKRLDIFYEARDNQWDGTVTIYHPVRCVI